MVRTITVVVALFSRPFITISGSIMITGTTFTAKFTLVLFLFDICFEVFSCFSTATGSFLKYNTLLFIFFTSRVLEDLLLPFYLFLLPFLITSFPGSFPVSVSPLHCKCSIHFHLHLTVTKLKITFFFWLRGYFTYGSINIFIAIIAGRQMKTTLFTTPASYKVLQLSK